MDGVFVFVVYLFNMKIIISENQKRNVVDHLLESEGITYTIRYGDGVYESNNRGSLDPVVFDFKIPVSNGFQHIEIWYIYLTVGNNVIDLETYNNIRHYIDVFKYIPFDVIMDYFYEKGKKFLEDLLPELNLYR